MSEKLRLTLACGDYEIVRAIKEGTVKPDGIELTVLTDMDSATRHWRMSRYREFDVCEFSWSTYLMAKFRGEALTAIPVFLHRRFRHGFIFINADKGIKQPTDLIGRNVGLKNFQATALVWIRGIMEDEFQVPHKKIYWHAEREEDVEFSPPEGLMLSRTPPGKRLESMLAEGELDAVIHPDLLAPILERDPRVKLLFENYKELEVDYYRRTGIFPIMHTTVIKQEIVDRYPWVPLNMMVAFERAKKIAYKRMENPRIVPLAWFRHSQEEQEEILGKDPWIYGLGEANRKNVETLMRYSHEQGMIGRRFSLDELFDKTTLGEEWNRPLSQA
ncbi:MAG: ABC transporter substrate-binding protein [Candidatus Binatia bacterium]